MKISRRTHCLLAGLIAVLLAFGAAPAARAGFSQGKYKGQKLNDTQKANFQKAVDKLRDLAKKDTKNNAAAMNRVADAMEIELKEGRINVEGAADPDWAGATLTDDKTSMNDDKVNLDPGLLNADSGSDFNLLVATLMHEGVHKTQPSGQTEAEDEGPAYAWTVHILEMLGETDADLLEFYRSMVRGYKPDSPFGKKHNVVKKANAVTSPSIEYRSTNIDGRTTFTVTIKTGLPVEPHYVISSFFDVFFDIAPALRNPGPTQQEALLLSGVDTVSSTQTQGNVHVYVDFTRDGIIEGTPAQLIQTPQNPLRFPRSIALDSQGNLFILDLGYAAPRIYVIQDKSPKDGLPDNVTTPGQIVLFADLGFFPAVPNFMDALSIWPVPLPQTGPTSGMLGLEVSDRSVMAGAWDWYAPQTTLIYNPATAVLQNFHVAPRYADASKIEPFFPIQPTEGDTTVVAGAGHTVDIEILALSLVSVNPIVIGHGTVTSPTLRAQVPLSAPLTSGTSLLIRDTTNGTTSTAPVPVLPPRAQGDWLEPERARSGEWVTIHGRFFPPDAHVGVLDIDAYTSPVLPTQLTFRMPFLLPQTDGPTSPPLTHYDLFTSAPVWLAIDSASQQHRAGEIGLIYLGEGPDVPPLLSLATSQTREAGATVMLDASGTVDPDRDALAFLWSQASGTPVTLQDAATSVARFVAPDVTSPEVLSFNVAVTDRRTSASATVTVAVVPHPPTPTPSPSPRPSPSPTPSPTSLPTPSTTPLPTQTPTGTPTPSPTPQPTQTPTPSPTAPPTRTPTPSPTPSPSPTPVTAPMILDFLLGQGTLTPAQKLQADKNGDGKIDVADVLSFLAAPVSRRPQTRR